MSDDGAMRVGGAAKAAPDGTAQYTGTLRRGEHANTIVGELIDSLGWRIELFGTLNAQGGYTLSGRVVAVPAALRIPAIDGK